MRVWSVASLSLAALIAAQCALSPAAIAKARKSSKHTTFYLEAKAGDPEFKVVKSGPASIVAECLRHGILYGI